MPTQTPLSLAAVSRWCLFFWKPTENAEKSRPIWRDDHFSFWRSTKTRKKIDQFGAITFFLDQQRTRRKVDQPKNFGPPERNFAPSRTTFLLRHCDQSCFSLYYFFAFYKQLITGCGKDVLKVLINYLN